jgi:hypothetical protein
MSKRRRLGRAAAIPLRSPAGKAAEARFRSRALSSVAQYPLESIDAQAFFDRYASQLGVSRQPIFEFHIHFALN